MSKKQFIGQHPGEKILFVFQQHILALRWGFIAVLIGLAVGSLPFIIWQDNVQLLWGAPLGFCLGLMVLFYKWINWRFSYFLVTNERIRQVVQRGLFNKSVIDINLNKVQNVSYNIPGLFGSIFGFGTLVLQTMVGNMVIRRAAHCEENYARLTDAIRAAGGLEKDDDEN